MNQLPPTNSLHPPDDAPGPAGYENDFVLWIERQVALLRAKKFEQLDLENVIEELDSMAGSQRRELKSRLATLIMHLLKCQFQPERKSGSWLGTLREQRTEIGLLIEDSPSLGTNIAEYADKVYEAAVDRAAHETGLPRSSFPARNPYVSEQLLDPAFIP